MVERKRQDLVAERTIRFQIWQLLYIVTVLASGMATFGTAGLLVAGLVVAFWSCVWLGFSRTAGYLLAFSVAGLVLFSALWLQAYSPRYMARQTECTNNLKQLTIAIHQYHDVHGELPPPYLVGPSGKPAHSWRVLILPYLGYQPLYNAYSFKEPWDGPNNQKLAQSMPWEFRCTSLSESRLSRGRSSKSNYFAVVGPDTMWPDGGGRTLADVASHSDRIILLTEADWEHTNWLEPVDVTLEEAIELQSTKNFENGSHSRPAFFSRYPPWRNMSFADGQVSLFRESQSVDEWKPMLTIQASAAAPRWQPSPSAKSPELDVGNCARFCFFVFLAMLPMFVEWWHAYKIESEW